MLCSKMSLRPACDRRNSVKEEKEEEWGGEKEEEKEEEGEEEEGAYKMTDYSLFQAI